MKRHLILASTCVLILGSGVSYAQINRSVRTKRDPKAGPILKVCFVSVEAEMKRQGMKGVEPLVPEGEAWGMKLRDTLTHAVTGSGWQLVPLAADSTISTEQLGQTVLQVKQKYDSISTQLYKKPGKVEKGRYSVGDEVALLPCAATADSLMFVDASAVLRTGSRRAFTMLIGGAAGAFMAQAGYAIAVAFVDSGTGEVTALTRINMMGGKTGTDPEKVLTARLVEEFTKMHPTTSKP